MTLVDWLNCSSSQTNVQRVILRQGDGKGHTNHQWKVEKSNDIRRRRYKSNVCGDFVGTCKIGYLWAKVK